MLARATRPRCATPARARRSSTRSCARTTAAPTSSWAATTPAWATTTAPTTPRRSSTSSTRGSSASARSSSSTRSGATCTGGMATAKTAPGRPTTRVFLSGTKVREMLRAGELPPAEFTRPEVAQILIEAYATDRGLPTGAPPPAPRAGRAPGAPVPADPRGLGPRRVGMMGPPVSRLRPAIAALAIVAAAAGPAGAAPATATARRSVSDWSHELNQNELPRLEPATAPAIAPRALVPAGAVDPARGREQRAVVQRAQRPAVPAAAARARRSRSGWRTPPRSSREFARTGLRWDVAYEVWAARKALRSARRPSPTPPPIRPRTRRRLSLLDPATARRRCARSAGSSPRCAGAPYVNSTRAATSRSAILPRGAGAAHAASGRALARDFRRATGVALPDPAATPIDERPRGAALAGVDPLLGRPLLRDEGGAGRASSGASTPARA